MRVDSHQHFWKFDPVRDSWITPEMQAIRRDFYPADLAPLLRQSDIDGCVAVQADQSEAETDFLIRLASENKFVLGVVGWVDLRASDLEQRLAHYSAIPIVKGFRHVIQGEPSGFMTDNQFIKGVRLLKKFRFTYDLLIYPHQLQESFDFIQALPNQPIVIDHLAKPYIKRGEIDQWKNDIARCASFENTWCKLSGMVTEADWQRWQPSNFHPYLDVVVEQFGIDRIIFGSDWPVCTIAAPYPTVVNLVEDYFSSFSDQEKKKVMGENAVRFYNL